MFNLSKILLIEDDSFLANMYNTKFSLEGFEVLGVSGGKKALRLAKKESPDLILLDLLLPGIDGFEILKSLKKEEKTKNIPVVVLTNLGEKEYIEKALSLGAVDYLIKAHFLPGEVVSKVRSLIRK